MGVDEASAGACSHLRGRSARAHGLAAALLMRPPPPALGPAGSRSACASRRRTPTPRTQWCEARPAAAVLALAPRLTPTARARSVSASGMCALHCHTNACALLPRHHRSGTSAAPGASAACSPSLALSVSAALSCRASCAFAPGCTRKFACCKACGLAILLSTHDGGCHAWLHPGTDAHTCQTPPHRARSLSQATPTSRVSSVCARTRRKARGMLLRCWHAAHLQNLHACA